MTLLFLLYLHFIDRLLVNWLLPSKTVDFIIIFIRKSRLSKKKSLQSLDFQVLSIIFQVTIINCQSMPERKKWTSQEDNMLITLRNEKKILNWSEIAVNMKKTFFQFEKNGKQCRERFHSHLQKANITNEWTQTDRQNLFQLHNKFGNKWAKIAQQMGNRTDNCVKNYFYSTMRKSVRRLNLIIRLSHSKNIKQLKQTDICVILDAFDAKFRQTNANWSQQEVRISQEIKNAMFQMSRLDLELNNIYLSEQLQELMQKINQFLKKGRKRMIKKHNVKKHVDKNYCPQIKYKKSQTSMKPTFQKIKNQQNFVEFGFNFVKDEHQNSEKLTNITNSIDSVITKQINLQIIKEQQFNNKKITKQYQNFNHQLVELNYPTFKMENEKIQSHFNINQVQQKNEEKNLFSIEENQFWQPPSFRSFKSFKSYSSLDNTLFN